MFIPHNHHEWLMHLFTVRKFRKINRDPKNKRVALSQRDFRILCENTHAQSAVLKIFFFMQIIHTNRKKIQCVKAFTQNIS